MRPTAAIEELAEVPSQVVLCTFPLQARGMSAVPECELPHAELAPGFSNGRHASE